MDGQIITTSIGNRGDARVSGVRPAAYHVHVEAEGLAFHGTLVVLARHADGHTPQLAVFSLQPDPGQPPAERARRRRGSVGGRSTPGTIVRIGADAPTVGAAVALGLAAALSERENRPVASP
jgi:hypothetical protein